MGLTARRKRLWIRRCWLPLAALASQQLLTPRRRRGSSKTICRDQIRRKDVPAPRSEWNALRGALHGGVQIREPRGRPANPRRRALREGRRPELQEVRRQDRRRGRTAWRSTRRMEVAMTVVGSGRAEVPAGSRWKVEGMIDSGRTKQCGAMRRRSLSLMW